MDAASRTVERRARMIEAVKTVLAVIGGLTVASVVAMAIIIFKR